MMQLTPGRAALGCTFALTAWAQTQQGEFLADVAAFRQQAQLWQGRRIALADDTTKKNTATPATLTDDRWKRLLACPAERAMGWSPLAAVRPPRRNNSLARADDPAGKTSPAPAFADLRAPEPVPAMDTAPADIAMLAALAPAGGGKARNVSAGDQTPAAAAYAALQSGETAAAVPLLRQALAVQPSGRLAADLGFAALRLGRRREAARAFETAVALGDADPQSARLWHRTAAQLTDRLIIDAYSFTRSGKDTADAFPTGIAPLGESQSAVAVQYRPDPLATRPLALTARVLAAGRPSDTSRQRHTFQPTAGLSWAAIPAANLNLAAERWFKAGNQSRSAWAMRAHAGYGEGYGPSPGRDSWSHWSVFGEAAMVGVHRRDLFAGTEARAGHGFALDDTTRATLTAGLWAMIQEDEQTRHRIEVGPGIAIDTWLGETPAQLRLDIRQPVSAKPRSDASVTLTVAFTL